MGPYKNGITVCNVASASFVYYQNGVEVRTRLTRDFRFETTLDPDGVTQTVRVIGSLRQ